MNQDDDASDSAFATARPNDPPSGEMNADRERDLFIPFDDDDDLQTVTSNIVDGI